MRFIDLNCDMGESFGPWQMGRDSELVKYASSINIACGFHAGDASTIRKTIELGIGSGAAIGAHPSYPDLQGFGRRNMSLAPREIFDIVVYQIAAVKGICESLGTRLHHVKPHGALYNQAAKDPVIARQIAEAIRSIDEALIFYGLSGSHLISEAKTAGLQTASEAFADRTYKSDGSLTPRSQENALIHDVDLAALQAVQMATEQTVISLDGETVAIKADTICIHGDGLHAVEFARAISQRLRDEGLEIQAP